MAGISCLTALLLILLVGGVSAQPITCEAGHFKEGQQAFVTCDFHRSLQDIPHHINVIHYPPNKPYDSGKSVLECYRALDHKLVCEGTVKGVQFDSIMKDSVTLTIPSVTEDFAGDYLCQLVPPYGTVISRCTLVVDGIPDDTNSRKQETSSLPMIVSVTLSVVAMITTIVIVCVVIIVRRRIEGFRREALDSPSRGSTEHGDRRADGVTETTDSQANENLASIEHYNHRHASFEFSTLQVTAAKVSSQVQMEMRPTMSNSRVYSPVNSGVRDENDPVKMYTIKPGPFQTPMGTYSSVRTQCSEQSKSSTDSSSGNLIAIDDSFHSTYSKIY